MKSQKKSKTMTDILIYAVLIIVAAATIFPMFYIIMGSFKTNIEILNDPAAIFPKKFSMDNYIKAWNSPEFQIGSMLIYSIIYTVWNVFWAVFVSSMAGYVFARGKFKTKKFWFICFSSIMFIKTGGIGIYATFEILHAIHLENSLYALMIMNAFGVQTVNMYLVMSYVKSLPYEIDEAGRIDGCTFFGIYAKLVLPMLKPVLATIAILAFQGSWNDYLMPTIFTVSHPEQRTLIVGLMALKSSGGAAAAWGLILAGSAIALLPILVVYTIGNRYFVSGLAAGAVKG